MLTPQRTVRTQGPCQWSVPTSEKTQAQKTKKSSQYLGIDGSDIKKNEMVSKFFLDGSDVYDMPRLDT